LSNFDLERRAYPFGRWPRISAIIHASGANDLTRIYFVTQRDGVDYKLAYVGGDFTVPHERTRIGASLAVWR